MVKSTLLLEINAVVKSSNSSLMTVELGQYENQRVSEFSECLYFANSRRLVITGCED